MGLRGAKAGAGSAGVVMSRTGDPSYSRVDGKPVVDVLSGDRAKVRAHHEEQCQILYKAGADPKDTMATDLARRCGMLRKVGLDAAAVYSYKYSLAASIRMATRCRRGNFG